MKRGPKDGRQAAANIRVLQGGQGPGGGEPPEDGGEETLEKALARLPIDEYARESVSLIPFDALHVKHKECGSCQLWGEGNEAREALAEMHADWVLGQSYDYLHKRLSEQVQRPPSRSAIHNHLTAHTPPSVRKLRDDIEDHHQTQLEAAEAAGPRRIQVEGAYILRKAKEQLALAVQVGRIEIRTVRDMEAILAMDEYYSRRESGSAGLDRMRAQVGYIIFALYRHVPPEIMALVAADVRAQQGRPLDRSIWGESAEPEPSPRERVGEPPRGPTEPAAPGRLASQLDEEVRRSLREETGDEEEDVSSRRAGGGPKAG